MKKHKNPAEISKGINRRQFIGIASGAGLAIGTGAILGTPPSYGQAPPPPPVKSNFDAVKDVPRSKNSLPGLFPGKVVEVQHSKVKRDEKVDLEIVREMINRGMEELTRKKGSDCWKLFIEPKDIVGIKINPVGPPTINTTLEIVDVIIENLVKIGLKKKNIIIWDRFEESLPPAGVTPERFPDVQLAGIQMMDEEMKDGWKDANGNHKSMANFDMNVSYWVDVDGPDDEKYLNQHVFNKKDSFFGKLVTQQLTKIINVPVLKNTGSGVSMATKNIGYAVIANTGRLHKPKFFDVCTEVLGFPCVRDKLVLNVLDGIRGQYDGGPGPNAKFVYQANKILFATDPFAQDYIGYLEMQEKRKADPSVKNNDSPRYTDYLRYAEKLGIGIADPEKINHKKIVLG